MRVCSLLFRALGMSRFVPALVLPWREQLKDATGRAGFQATFVVGELRPLKPFSACAVAMGYFQGSKEAGVGLRIPRGATSCHAQDALGDPRSCLLGPPHGRTPARRAEQKVPSAAWAGGVHYREVLGGPWLCGSPSDEGKALEEPSSPGQVGSGPGGSLSSPTPSSCALEWLLQRVEA